MELRPITSIYVVKGSELFSREQETVPDSVVGSTERMHTAPKQSPPMKETRFSCLCGTASRERLEAPVRGFR